MLAAVEAGTYGRPSRVGDGGPDCALRAVLRPGDHVVIPDDAYGGTFRSSTRSSGWGMHHPRAAGRPRRGPDGDHRQTRLIWVETPTNPLLSIADIPAIVEHLRHRA